MSINTVNRKGLVAVIALLCLLPLSHPTAVVSAVAQGGACGPSTRGLDRLKADLGLDSGLANRANSLASSALRSGQQPAPTATQSLTDDSLEGLSDAGDQLDQAVDELGKQLDGMNLPRQQRLWNQSVSTLKSARSTLKSALRQDPIGRGQRIGSLSASGVGPTTLYEAASNYQGAVENLGGTPISFDQAGQTGSLLDTNQNGWMDVAKGQGQVSTGRPDTAPPMNPEPDPWQEWLKRLRAQQARIQNSVNGLHAAQALRAGQFQQAQQNAADMQKAIQNMQGVANQLGQMVAACNQAVNQRSQNGPSTQPKSPNAPATTPAASGGGGIGGPLVVGALVGGAALGGLALYQASQCKEPDIQSDLSTCSTGNCSGCVRLGEKLIPWCDCLEKKHAEASGVSSACRDYTSEMKQLKAYYRCEPPAVFSPIPESAVIR